MLGCLPDNPELNLPSRHLGLAPAHEIKNLSQRLDSWACIAEKHLNLKIIDNLLKAPDSKCSPLDKFKEKINYQTNLKRYPVALAEDEAFHFRYAEMKEFLEDLIGPTIPWKPLNNEKVPREAKGIIIPA